VEAWVNRPKLECLWISLLGVWGQHSQEKILARFAAHCKSYVQDIETVFWWLEFGCCCHLERVWKTVVALCIFSLIVVKFLQRRGRRQIAKSCKYCLMHVIVFLWHVFSLFFLFLTGWEFQVDSLHHTTTNLS